MPVTIAERDFRQSTPMTSMRRTSAARTPIINIGASGMDGTVTAST